MAEKKLQKQLQVAANELARLRAENQALRKMLGIDQDFKITSQNAAPPKGPVNDGSTNREKVSFFLKLFQGRGDTYAVRWTNRKGKAGYSPACKNEWTNSCGKGRKVSCADCHHRSFLPLDAKAVA